MATECEGHNNIATEADNAEHGVDNNQQKQDAGTMIAAAKSPTSPDITITNAAGRRNGGGGGSAAAGSGSGSETSGESDQQGLVVTFRKTSGGGKDRQSGSEARISSGSSENVSFSMADRRSTNSSGKQSIATTTANNGVYNPSAEVSPSDSAGATKTAVVSPRSQATRKTSGSSSNAACPPSSNAGVNTSTTSLASNNNNNSNSNSGSTQTQAGQQQQLTPASEKTRLQSAATQLKNFLAPNYKSRSEEFKKLFKPAENDKFVIDYSCAYQREILVHGRMYMSQHLLCFYANIFKWETTIIVRLKDITSISKEKTAKFIPNALQFCNKSGEKLFFTSFSMRDKAYMMVFRIWQNALMDRLMHPAELYTLENQGYDEAEFSGSDNEAEDALAILGDESDKTNGGGEGDFENLRRVAASSASNSVGGSTVPPLTNLCNGDSVPGSEDSTARSKFGGGGGTEDNIGGGPSKPRKAPRVAPENGGSVGSPATAATTPGEEYTESENDNEINCPCTSHNGKEMLNCLYPISVDQLFLLLFTDSAFFRKLHEDRKTTNLVLSDWHVDKTTSTKSRQITYIVALNHSVGPKSCAVTEKQTCTTMSKPGQLYVMKSEVSNSGIPYSDAFSIGVQYCLSRVSANQCRIRVHAGIVYKKSCWGIVKSFIDKNALAGMEDYFTDLNTHLRAECARFGLTEIVDEAKTNVEAADGRFRRQSGIAPGADIPDSRSPARKSISSGVTYPLLPNEIENIAKGILLVLILMLLLNAALFYKLWYFEAEAERGSFEHSLRDFERVLQKSDSMPSQWLHAFQKVRFVQKKQLAKWLEELDGAVTHLAAVQKSLLEMRKQIATMQKDLSIDPNLQVDRDPPKEKEP